MYNAYHEKGGFFDGTALVKSMIETDDQFFERRRVSYYENFVKPIIDATYLPVFAEAVKRETIVDGEVDKDGKGAPLWAAFCADCDRRGTSLADYMQKLAKHARMLGACFIVMDNFPDAVGMLLQDALKERWFPFLALRLPQQVESRLLVLDDAGQLEQIGFVERPVKNSAGEDEPRWKVWTKDRCVEFTKDKGGNFAEVTGTEVRHSLNRVPVIPMFSLQAEEGTILPQPPYYSIARCNWALYNICSTQMRLLRSQMFAILCLPKMEGGFAAGAQRGFELPADNTQTGEKYPQPMYLAPPVGPYQEITTTITHLREELYRLAGQEGISGVRESRSGIAKAFDFSAEEWVLKDTAKMTAVAEKKIGELFLAFTGEKFEYSVAYTETYKPTYYDDRLTRDSKIIEDVSTLSTPYNPIVAALVKDMVEMFYQGSDDSKNELLGWIDQNTDKAASGEAGVPPTPEELAEGGSNPVKDLLESVLSRFKRKVGDEIGADVEKKGGGADADNA
jgi:hypothetical protein